MIKNKVFIFLIAVSVILGTVLPLPVHAYTFDGNDIIDDSVFNNFGSMGSAQIDSFLNGFPNSCISANSGFMAIDPTGYNASTGFQYGGFVTAGKVINDAAQAYSLNPQVLITTLEKEQSLVTGRNNFSGYCNNGDQHKYAAAVGYGCPDSGTTYSYTGLSLYQRNGTTVSSTGTTCVNSSSKAGFSQQVIRAAWLLKFGQQRSRGNVGWAVVKGNWDNSDDPQSCYGGPTTQGTFAVCPSAAATYHDGYYTIDGTTVHIDSGATAALYWYTPHFHGNQVFFDMFTQWFGSTKSVPMPGCDEATNTTRACVWAMSSPTGQPFFASSVDLRQWYVDSLNYDYTGKAFFGNAVSLPGNVPIYRIEKSNGNDLLTANKAEYDALVAAGYTGGGIDFYADPGNTNTGYPVYRMYLGSTQTHRFVASVGERDSLISQGYTNEGVAFTSISTVRQEIAPPAGVELVYRFSNMPGNTHFWTRDVYERDQMIKSGYHYEGVSWYANQAATSASVYRLYQPSTQQHLYTKDTWEKFVLTSQHGWVDEGVSLYTNPTQNNSPVYRLYNPKSDEHLYTADSYEKSVLVGRDIFRDEGTAWYQP